MSPLLILGIVLFSYFAGFGTARWLARDAARATRDKLQLLAELRETEAQKPTNRATANNEPVA